MISTYRFLAILPSLESNNDSCLYNMLSLMTYLTRLRYTESRVTGDLGLYLAISLLVAAPRMVCLCVLIMSRM